MEEFPETRKMPKFTGTKEFAYTSKFIVSEVNSNKDDDLSEYNYLYSVIVYDMVSDLSLSDFLAMNEVCLQTSDYANQSRRFY